jgi:hypothetical protein
MKKGFLAVGMMCALMTGSARAGFQFNYTVTSGTGALEGTNIFKFYAKNDQTGEQLNTHLLLGVSGTMQSLGGGAFTFDRRDVDGDGLVDANVKGLGISESNITGSFMRIGLYSDWDLGVPEVSILPAKPFTKTGGNPSAFNSTLSWGLDGVNLAANTNPSTLEAAQGLGAFFGAAVVPAGSDVKVSGRLAAEKGGVVIGGSAPLPSDPEALVGAGISPELNSIIAASNLEVGTFVPFSFTATAPEPGTIGLMASCVAGALMRRRARRAE